ncbi:response regulator transcription factor [Methyloceanibacter caenitepidi]|uniref:Cell cycle response regulator CtrA n=1 Tax=Methyloceanibacter caenitepidi TaxID=1384459 RepID=A0A0A8K969_9HYPH|nr:response regulator transcription factor [Methyloceanibacter caenitepidi]BAQ18599.1 transcriptional regulator [Methyloceanibacter caenitepidi]
MNVLLVEDEPRVADFIDRGLRAENHGVTVAENGGDGIELAKTGDFDVIVLDLMLPDMHGYDVCQRLRQDGQHTPILMLTAMDAIEDKIKGIKLGADDYLTKPFDFDELLVRIEALVRRSHNFTPSSNVLTVGDLELDRELLEVKRGDEPIKLTAKELAILELLMSSPGRVFSRTRILNQVWGYSEDPLTNVVDVYIARLRRKIDTKGREPLIETVRGHGYRLKPAAAG